MSTVKLGTAGDDFFKKYDRKFIQLDRNTAMLIHLFEKFFSEDPKWAPTSHHEILMLSDNIRRLREDKNLHYNDINFDAIPKKYEYLINQYKELCKK